MKHGSISPFLLLSALLAAPAQAQHGGEAMCGDTAHPLLTAPDFNADGAVDAADVTEVAQAVEAQIYYALYDRDADGALTDADIKATALSLGSSSTTADRFRASTYQRYKHLQTARGAAEIMGQGFSPFPVPLAGHGNHWLSEAGSAALLGFRDSTVWVADGLNVPYAADRPWAMFWGQAADPVFEGGASDYPWGEEWKTQRVVAFGDAPPNFTGEADEKWHTHAGLCVTFLPDNSPYGVAATFHQHTTYAECQSYPSVVKGFYGDNMWVNIWMLHMWFFELNPAGFYGGVHPCLDPWAPSEGSINEDREVPMFFMHHDD